MSRKTLSPHHPNEFQTYACDIDGKLVHCGVHNVKRVNVKTAKKLQRKWRLWRFTKGEIEMLAEIKEISVVHANDIGIYGYAGAAYYTIACRDGTIISADDVVFNDLVEWSNPRDRKWTRYAQEHASIQPRAKEMRGKIIYHRRELSGEINAY